MQNCCLGKFFEVRNFKKWLYLVEFWTSSLKNFRSSISSGDFEIFCMKFFEGGGGLFGLIRDFFPRKLKKFLLYVVIYIPNSSPGYPLSKKLKLPSIVCQILILYCKKFVEKFLVVSKMTKIDNFFIFVA